MSFQGDVRGIGLAELLQGLARGRKEGILSLSAKGGARSVLGVDGGSVYLLPDPEEDIETWRDRVRNAYADDPQFRIDALRMTEIAKAVRLERLYDLLDGEGAHFRFDPGVVPGRDRTGGDETRAHIYCDGIPIEFLLLEYARISDELEGAGDLSLLAEDVVPRVLDPDVPPDPANRRFHEQCNGLSTLGETADRLGWTLRQTRIALIGELRAGRVYLAHSTEVLELALVELSRANIQRAAARITSWCRDGDPGALPIELADALAGEWLAGRLTSALVVMKPRTVRTLLRRLDRAICNPASAVVHWEEAGRVHPFDKIARLHRMACEFRDESIPGRPDLRQLLDMARAFREADRPWRSGPVLVMAAHLQPDTPLTQIELGQGLLQAGRIQEGAPWILSGAASLLDQDEADRAVVPLRALIEKDHHNRECRQLLARARRSTTQVRRLRKHLVIGLAITALAGAGAMVQVRREHEFQRQLDYVHGLLTQPKLALAELDRLFPDEQRVEILRLRNDMHERQRLDELAKRNDWVKAYNDASKECTSGDPILGLTLALELAEPPRLGLLRDPWPLRKDLYNGLIQGFEARILALGAPSNAHPGQLQSEQALLRQIDQLATILEELAEPSVELAELAVGLGRISDDLARREQKRERAREQQAVREIEQMQDELWTRALEHASRGDFDRADQVYEELLATDSSGKIGEVLADEIQGNRERLEAVHTAQSLCAEGRHDRALELLREKLQDRYDPYAYTMPWDVTSFPSGAHVRIADGEEQATPFTLRTTFGESTSLMASLAGFEPREVFVERPGDQHIFLSRTPERAWRGEGRVDALPVQLEDGSTIVVDRGGRMARIGSGGALRWQTHIQTLSGIARAPVFMPDLPGHLLMVTQDGKAWMVAEANGDLQGPWDLGSPPVAGPYQAQKVVRVRLQDGTVTYWKDRLRPYMPTAQTGGALEDRDEEYRFGSSGGLQVLRRRRDLARQLDSRWRDWSVRVEDEVYRVQPGGAPEAAYTVLREGEWEFLAWEAPRTSLPEGRLWVSDGAGLRAFVPLD